MESDELLIQRFQGGDVEAFGALYDRYIRKIYDFIYFRTQHRETAEDATSQAFMKALEALPSFDATKGTFQAWLYRIARNTVIDLYRSRRETVPLEEFHATVGQRDVIEHMIDRSTIDRIGELLHRLSDEQREIVLLRLRSGLSYKEIAAVIGKTEANCKVIFSRSVAYLRSQLAVLLFLIMSMSNHA